MSLTSELLLLGLVGMAKGHVDASVPKAQSMCDSIHSLQCYGDDLKNFGKVTTHEACCAACQAVSGCNAWTWNWKYGGDCYLKSACSDKRTDSDAYHSGYGTSPGPSPPSPPAPPPTPGHSDLQLTWVTGRGHGACNGPAVQGDDVVKLLGGNDIQLSTDASPNGGCVFRTAQPAIDLDQYPHIEADLETSGSMPAYGSHSGQWFSFWMYPPQYAYKHGIADSGEVDFVENINSVRTNFAGCTHNCHETSWGQQSNAVKAHVTMHFDTSTQTVNIYRCAFGENTCSTDGERAYVELQAMQVNKPYVYTLCTDVWYAKPGMNFKFSVTNLRVLRTTAANITNERIII